MVALRVAQEDHLETEEAMVIPFLQENLSPKCQLKVVGALLIDQEADDTHWVIEWISQTLPPKRTGYTLIWSPGSNNCNPWLNRFQSPDCPEGEEMPAGNTHRLEDPIDVMPLMHKAFRAVSDRTEAMAAKAVTFDDIAELNEEFSHWTKQLLYHAGVEDEVMTGPLKDNQPARDNETEHTELAGKAGDLTSFIAMGNGAGLEESVREAAFSLEEEQHLALEEKFHEVETALKDVLGENEVTAWIIRHIHSRLIGVRILELDHFENQEAFVISLVRDETDEPQQLDIVRRLLIDESAEDPLGSSIGSTRNWTRRTKPY